MMGLKENLQSCSQEPFLIANQKSSSIPAGTWANSNTVLPKYEKGKEKKKKSIEPFYPPSPFYLDSAPLSGALGHGGHACAL